MTIFIVAGVGALLVFSGLVDVGQRNTTEAQGSVTVWGTIPYATLQKYIDKIATEDLNVRYEEQDPATYEYDLVNALAASRGPDLFIMSHEHLLRNKDKIFEIPYANLPRATYESRYIREAELFLTDTGVLALPIMTDPLVMYYNKSLMNAAFILDVPQYWDEVLTFTPEITVSNANGEINISGAALGTFDNIETAKAILSTMMIQNGNQLVGVDPATGQYRSTLALSQEYSEEARKALEFFISFSDIGKANYSWNEALPQAKEMFLAGDLALYFGKGSEITDIRRKNPNLDFDVAFLPQLRESTRKSTFGYMTGIAVSKQSKNVAGALAVASALTGGEIVNDLSAEMGQVPARIDLLGKKPDEAYLNLYYYSAVNSDAWVDPDPSLTDDLFQDLIRNVNAGAMSLPEALTRAHTDLNEILKTTINTTIENKTLEGFEG